MAAPDATTTPDPATHAWARSGAMILTGPADGSACVGPASIALRAAELASRVEDRSAACVGNALPPLDGPSLLGERAAVLGLRRRGRVSPGGSCRLLATRDGWIALNLARPDDRSLLPAWLEAEARGDTWAFVASAVGDRSCQELVARGRMMGLAVAAAEGWRAAGPPWRQRLGLARSAPPARPVVIDLSSLWAGPLCTQLLSRAGARVIKVESTARPDAARGGPAAFFDRLHAGKESVALDFTRRGGREALRRLVARADLVVESSRPRALRQLGLHDEAILAEHPGLSWLSITGHGARGPGADWVAFGDDAAIAAGLGWASGRSRGPIFCGDAIADPLAGLEAADEALRALEGDGGLRVDVSLVGAARRAFDGTVRTGPVPAARPPRAPKAGGRARALGADSAAVLREFGIR